LPEEQELDSLGKRVPTNFLLTSVNEAEPHDMRYEAEPRNERRTATETIRIRKSCENRRRKRMLKKQPPEFSTKKMGILSPHFRKIEYQRYPDRLSCCVGIAA